MNDYRYEDLKIGMTESFDVSITEQMLETFRQLSGDENPLQGSAMVCSPPLSSRL